MDRHSDAICPGKSFSSLHGDLAVNRGGCLAQNNDTIHIAIHNIHRRHALHDPKYTACQYALGFPSSCCFVLLRVFGAEDEEEAKAR